MNRTDRLHAISEALRRAGSTGMTSARLADDLEVSIRTIKRDVSALQQTGALIWAQPGPGGGYVLDTAANLPPVAFTPSQAVAVATALAVLPVGSPFSVDVRNASAKLFDTLGSASKERANALASKVWVHSEEPEARAPAGVLRAIERSLAEQLALSLRYRNAAGGRSKRVVEPIIAAWAYGRWYLVSYCRNREDIRWFRFDRIEKAAVTSDRYEPRSAMEIGTPPDTARPVGQIVT